MLSKKIIKDSHVNIETVLNLLENGELIALPTETVYALSCDPTNETAVKKIYEIKQRDIRKPLALLCSDITMIKKFAQLSEIEEKLIERFSPGPLSLVVKLKKDSPFDVDFNSGKDTVAVRIPDSKFLLKLLSQFQKPIIGTSVNRSGEPPLLDPIIIEEQFSKKISLIVTSDEHFLGEASTVIEVIENKASIIRNGYIDSKTINNFIEQNI